MSRSLDRQVAASLDAPVEALPELPALLAGLRSLGGNPARAARWLAGAGIGKRSRVIDLGSGNGAVAIEIARRTGARVRGIDGLDAFVGLAAARAAAAGVEDRCRFEHGDLARVLRRTAPRFDAAVMTCVLPVLEAATLLRRAVPPGGVAFIEDAVRSPDSRAWSGAPPTAQRVREHLSRSGWSVVRERIDTARQTRDAEARAQRTISRRAQTLIRRTPHAADVIREVLARQRMAAAALTGGRILGASWLLRRQR